jgi:hypothetical protein
MCRGPVRIPGPRGPVHEGRTSLYRALKRDCDVCPIRVERGTTDARKILRDFHDNASDTVGFVNAPAHEDYSGAAPTGGPPGGRCRNVIDANAPSHEPAAAKPT